MKKIAAILILSLLFLPVEAGTKHRVTLVKQYVAGEQALPSKTIEAKVPVMRLLPGGKNPFPATLSTFLGEVTGKDTHNNVYVLDLRYGGAGIVIQLTACDILEPEAPQKYYGDLVIDNRKHLLLAEDGENKALLKQFFLRERGSETVFTRVFESVLDLDEEQPTRVRAVYNERTRAIDKKEVVIAGEDMLAPRQAKAPVPEQIQTEDEDPFKIDVELMDE